MTLCIKIDQGIAEEIVLYGRIPKDYENTIIDAIKNGSPLPEHHGRLIDADAFIDFLKNTSKTHRYNEFIIDKKLTGLTVDDVFNAVCESLQNEGLAENDSPTILEADKESDTNGK